MPGFKVIPYNDLKALEVRHRLAHDQCDQTARIFFDSWLHTYLLTHAQ